MVAGAGGIVKSGSGSDWRRLTSRFPSNFNVMSNLQLL